MAGFTNAVSKSLIDSWVAGITPYVALYTTNPGEDGTGGVEANYTGYARQPVTFNAATTADPSVATNNGAITFPICTVGTNAILGWAIVNGLAGATPLYVGITTDESWNPLTLTVTVGVTPVIGNGYLQVRLD
jgi:hypothetical protein